MLNDIGKSNEGIINDGLDSVGYLIRHYKDLGSLIADLVVVYGSYKTALMVIGALRKANLRWSRLIIQQSKVEMALNKAITRTEARRIASSKLLSRALIKQQLAQLKANATAMANPYVAVAAAVAALAYGVYKLATAESASEKATKSFNEHLKKQKELAEQERQELEETINVIKDEISTRTEKQLALEKLQQKYPSIFQNMNIETVKLAKIKELLKLGNEEREKRVRLEDENQISEAEKILYSKPSTTKMMIGDQAVDTPEYLEYKRKVRKLAEELQIDEGWLKTEASFGKIVTAIKERIKKQRQKLKDDFSAKVKADFEAQTPEQKKAFYEEQNKKLKQELETKKKRLADAKKSNLPTSYINADIIAIEKQIKANEKLITTYNKEQESYTRASKVKAEALKKIAQAQAEIKRLQDTKMDSSKRAELIAKENEKIKEQKELIKKQGYQLSKQRKTTIAKEEKDYTADLQRIAIEKARTKKDLEFQVREAEIKAMQEGLKKKLAQNELNYQKEIEQLKRQREDRLKQLNEQERTEWEAKHPKHKEQKLKYISRIALPEQDEINFAKLEGNVGIRFNASNEKAYTDELNKQAEFVRAYLDKAQELEEKKKALKKQGYSDSQVSEISRIEQEGLDALNEQMGISEEFVTTIANDLIGMGVESVIEKLHEAEEILKAEGQKSGADKAKIKALQQKVNALKVALKNKTKEQSKPPKTDDWKNTVNILMKVNSTAQQAAEGFEGLSDAGKKTVSVLFSVSSGAISIISAIESVTENAIRSTEATAKTGAKAIRTVEKATAILAAISAALQIAKKIASIISGSNKAHQEALEKIKKAQIATQREYNRLLFEQNMLMKEAGNIFGVDSLAKALRHLSLYNEKLKEVQDKLKKKWHTNTVDLGFIKFSWKTFESDLERIKVKTGSYTHGWGFWKKQHDEFGSILKVYPELIKADGTFNKQMAEAALKKEQFADKHKEQLEEIIQKYDQMEEAEKAFDGYMKDTFGELGQGMMDSVVKALKTGEDAFKSFGETVGKVMAKLGQQTIYNATLKPFLDDLNKKIKNAYQDEKNIVYKEGHSYGILGRRTKKIKDETATIKNITNDVVGIIGASMGEMKNVMEVAKAGYKAFNDNLKNVVGIDVLSEDQRREASKKGFDAMTQDQAGKLGGQFAVMTKLKRQSLDTVKGIASDIKYLQTNAAKQLEYLASIDANTETLHDVKTNIASVKSGIDDINTKGVKIRG